MGQGGRVEPELFSQSLVTLPGPMGNGRYYSRVKYQILQSPHLRHLWRKYRYLPRHNIPVDHLARDVIISWQKGKIMLFPCFYS